MEMLSIQQDPCRHKCEFYASLAYMHRRADACAAIIAGRVAMASLLPMTRSGTLIDKAISSTGVSNFGEESFREGLDRLVASTDEHARFHELGAAAFDMQIVDLLSQRLQVEDWYCRHPEIDEEQIVAPLIGLGLPRTGSTALAFLLGEDVNARSLRNWEAMRPCPPPYAEPDSVWERIALAEAGMERRAKLFPRMVQMLPSTATGPTECQLLMAQDFKSQIFPAFANVPSYVDWFENEADLEPTYRHVKRVLKLLQWRGGSKIWRLKNPTHSLFIDKLYKVFPDAKFVMTHREISQVIPSVADVYFELSSAYSDHVDPKALAAMNIESWDKAMHRMMAFRDDGHESLFFDIAFKPFMQDPFPQLEKLYDFIGEQLTPETRKSMQLWRDASPRDKHGRHEIDMNAFAIDLAALRDRFAFYSNRYERMFDGVSKQESTHV
jgi:hypothetical protein